jgi:uncharacterized delta-60 repeat protein
MKAVLGILAGAIIFISSVHAQFMRVDPNFAPKIDDWIRFTRVQPDGKILIAGYFTNVNGIARPQFARLHSDGSLDETFTPQFPSSGQATIWQLDVAGTNIYLLTYADGAMRYTLDGVLERRYPLGWNFVVDSQKRLTFGTIVYLCRYTPHVWRYREDGLIDTNFTAELDCYGVANGAGSGVYDLAIQRDGQQEKVLVAGFFGKVRTNDVFGLARLNEDGSVDTTFHSTTNMRVIGALAVQEDGKILGAVDSGPSLTYGHYLNRWFADGTLDPGFNSGSLPEPIGSILPQLNGGVLAISRNSSGEYSIRRFQPDGTPDTNFLVQTTNDYNRVLGGQNIYTMALQPDGGILIAGRFTNVNCMGQSFIARLIPSDTPDALPCPLRPEPTLTATRLHGGVMQICIPTGYGDYWVQAARHINRRHPDQTKWVNVHDKYKQQWWYNSPTNSCIEINIARFGRNYRLVKRY